MMIILLPTIVLLGFISKFLMDDINSIRKMNDAVIITSVSEEIGATIAALVDEESYSLIEINKDVKQDQGALNHARNISDQMISTLKKSIVEVSVIIDGLSFSTLFASTIDKLNSINVIRRQVDNKSISLNEVQDYFESIDNEFLKELAQIANHEENLSIGRTLYADIILSHEIMSASRERNLLYHVFFKNKITREEYTDLLGLINSQDAYRQTFYEIATSDQDALYQKMTSIPDVREANQLRQLVITNPDSEAFDVDPQTWWRKQSQKIHSLEDIGKTLVEKNIDLAINLKNSYQSSLFWVIGLLAVTMVLTIVLIIVFFRSLTEKLQEEIDTLTVSGKEISTSISETSAGSAETASAVTETTTTVEELKQTAEVAAEKARNVSDVSEDALQVLRTSEDALESTIRGMTNIQEGMETISESIIKLSEHSQTIGEIIDTVNDLAEQSHLLAVNAAIEAAKAGDQGKGFAVVAQEVRSLAEQSKQATVQIRNILNDIQNSTSAAVMATEQGSKAVAVGMGQSEKTNESIRSIYEGIEKVSEAASQIAVTSQQQLVGVEQVTIAMASIRESTSQQADHMRTIENGMVGLTDVGNSLQKLIEEYTLIKR